MTSMRENGLRAAAYVAVADLHPQLADVMLAALADEGVAAYASPSPSVSGRGLTMPAQLPAGPVDRLWVDRDAAATARRVLDDKLPELRAELENATADTVIGRTDRTPAPDTTPGGVLVDDDTWAEIIASYRAESAPHHAIDEHALDDDAAEVQPSRRAADGSAEEWPEVREVAAKSRPRPAEDHGDHYEPPPPPPLPTADTTTRMAWAGVIGGPLLFLLSIFLDWDLASWAKLAGVAAMVIGFVTLVARMREGGEDDGSDNGAVV